MADDRPRHYDSDDEEEEEIDETQYQAQKDAVIFAIEVSSSMLQEPPEPAEEDSYKRKKTRDSPASAALKCAYELMQQRIISNPKDMIGVLLYGTEDSKFQDESARGGIAHPHCYLLVDLCVPAAEEVKTLRNLVEDPEKFAKIMKPTKDQMSMANVLFCANQVFTTKAPNFASRRLFLITDEDNPHEANKSLRSNAAVRARDLYDLGVTVELFPISKPGRSFNRQRFYNDIIYSHTPSDPEAPMPLERDVRAASSDDGINLLHSLLSSIRSRSVPKRALFANLPLELGPSLKISVKGYIIFKKQEPARRSYIWLKGEKAQIVTSHSSKQTDDIGKPVDKASIRKAFKFGGAQVSFTPDEILQLRNFGDPCIRILGFKPQSTLQFWANIRPSTFIYPSEEGYIGSTRVFSALQQKLLKDEKLAVAWFVPRKNAIPVIAALLPGKEKLNDDNEQVIPPGMWIVPLPFADDIRKNPDITNVVAPDEVVDKMIPIIQQLQLPKASYFPERYPNPSLQWHYKILQALALDEDVPTQPEDKTVPKYRQIDKRAGPYVQDWAGELEKAHKEWQMEHRDLAIDMVGSGAKRPRSANVKEVTDRSKKVKSEDDGMSDETMSMAFQKQSLEKFKVADLKAWLEGKGINAQGKKADLVDRVEQYFEKK